VDTFPFAPGDMLVLYTDGVSEARDSTDRPDRFYPLDERLSAWKDADTPGDLLLLLRNDIVGYCGGTFQDDAALVVVRREAVTGRESPAQAGQSARRPSLTHRSLRR
jgi:serine phosphatase RsbU (regulator of sigma subunit)